MHVIHALKLPFLLVIKLKQYTQFMQGLSLMPVIGYAGHAGLTSIAGHIGQSFYHAAYTFSLSHA